MAQEGLRKELNWAIGSKWPWKCVFVGCCRKKSCLGGKVVGGQMTSPHTGSLGTFGETAVDLPSGERRSASNSAMSCVVLADFFLFLVRRGAQGTDIYGHKKFQSLSEETSGPLSSNPSHSPDFSFLICRNFNGHQDSHRRAGLDSQSCIRGECQTLHPSVCCVVLGL